MGHHLLLQKFGFHNCQINWIMCCVTATSFSVIRALSKVIHSVGDPQRHKEVHLHLPLLENTLEVEELAPLLCHRCAHKLLTEMPQANSFLFVVLLGCCTQHILRFGPGRKKEKKKKIYMKPLSTERAAKVLSDLQFVIISII